MMRRSVGGCVLMVLIVMTSFAQEPGKAPGQIRAMAIEGMIASTGEDSLRQFIETHLAPTYRESLSPEALREQLLAIRAACANSGGILLNRLGEGTTRITFVQGPRRTSVLFKLEPTPPNRIVSLVLEPSSAEADARPEIAPIRWETLAPRLEEEAKKGFSGTILVVKGGATIHHRAYGMADRERGRPNTTETIYAIGSLPIDFTRGAILKLEQMGKLRTSDPIGKFLPVVPDDKRGITLDHLMSGQSGLPDFHHIIGVDADFDLSWIDRQTAIHRIMGQTLLFGPGKGRAHSHSAWGLLAAIVEIASNQSYGEFLRQHFFEPAGMTRTGLHEDAAIFADDQFAVGYGHASVGKLNISKYWGETSWLVMGSGGMYSTPADLQRWLSAIRQGKTLSPAAAAKYWSGGVLSGGDERGFLCIYTEGPENLMIMFSNAHTPRNDQANLVAARLVEMVNEAPERRFRLGVQFRVEADGPVAVAEVMPGSAAERDGLKAGDLLISANGTPMRDPILPILDPFLKNGGEITFEVDRAGTRLKVTVRLP